MWDSTRYLRLESDFKLHSVYLAEIGNREEVDVVVLGNHFGKNVIDVITTIKSIHSGLKIVVTALNMDDATILTAIAAGAKGYVDEAAPVGELVRAIRTVVSGSVWAPRRVLAMFVEKTCTSEGRSALVGHQAITRREKEVLRMLVEGCSNKEIAAPLGIEERTVKAHVAKLMRKVGATNRVLLSVHAITHSLVGFGRS